jgi:hypothetical protein
VVEWPKIQVNRALVKPQVATLAQIQAVVVVAEIMEIPDLGIKMPDRA